MKLASTRSRAAGFTLIEMMCVVAIACLLAAIAYPSYQALVLRSRRFDAQAALLQLQGYEERYRAANPGYASLGDLGAPAASPAGFYRLSVTSASSAGYVLLASAQERQQADAVCRHLKLAVDGENVVYASGTDTSTANSPADNRRCWGI
jgi:type IV pilus assembly protein PilE